MTVTERMLMGAIASNPGSYEGAGEYRYSLTSHEIYFTSAARPDAAHADHEWIALPALNPDGSGKLERAFRRFMTRWPAERQEELQTFARRKGWEMAMELKYGGGALDDDEAAEWQEIINGRLTQLVKQARREIDTALQQRAPVL
ncbi:MAG TPA: hypothetical protein PKA05_11790 [Roseiflexaceae bacterium]|mgnify:CR=1 FL=1|nr:hypothetical protein [Roseiflexaceae bacterium]HMP41055.1 hypothetical protein [Roseiflexaceae bacterium]